MFDSKLATAAARVRDALSGKSAEKAAEMNDALAVTFAEHFAMQNAQSHAFAGGAISQGDATYIYAALGEGFDADNGGWASGTDVATKYVVTCAVGELLRRKIAARV